ncbi:hypothetical protein KR018_004976 [Drosophila ironensis]|nr:hypothetical protein KR018_004976 [Drosophila ironensis]
MTTANLPRVPDGLRDLMKIYTKEVLREKPADLYAFSANFFNLIVGEKSHQTVRKYEPVQTYETIMKNRIRQQVPISMVFNIIPETLTDLIKQFIKAVLREKPENIYIFAQEYFQRLAKEKSGRTEYTKYATYEKSLKDKEKVSPVSKVTCECGRILSANKTDVGSPSATPVTPKGDEKRGVLSVSYLKSVVIIQRYFRRYLKQKKTDLTKKDKCNSVEYITSILIIQRQFRRILAKKRVEKLKVLRSQEPKAVNHTANYMRAVVIIQRHYRIFLKKKQEQNRLKTRKVSLATAAIIIQRAFRRMVAVHRAKRAASAGTDQAEELNDNASETGSYTSVSTALLSTESNELGGTNYEERVHQQIIHEDVEVENSNVAGSLEKEYFAEPISDEEKSIHLRKTGNCSYILQKPTAHLNCPTILSPKEEVEDEFIAIKKTEPEFKPKKAETTLETEEELISDEANIDSKSENEPSYESERSIDGQEPERKMSMEKIRNAQDLEEEMQSKMENDSVIKEPEDQQIETAERKLQNISKKGDDEETTPLKISGDIRDITQNIDENDTETSAPTRCKRSMEEIETEIDTIPETSKNSTEVSPVDKSMTKDIVHRTNEPTLSSSIEKEDIPKFNEKSQSPPLNTETKSIEETEPGQEQTLPSNQTEDDNNQKPTEESDEKVIVAETSLESIKEISKNITEDSSIHDSLENESPKVEHLPTNLNKSNEEENKTIMDPQLSLDKTPEIESPKVEHLPTNLSQSDEDEKNTTENVPIVMDAPEENLHENNIPKSNDHKSLEDISRPASIETQKNSSLLVNNQLIGTQNLPTNHIEIEKNTKKHPSANVKDKDIGTLSSGRLVPTPIAELQLKSFKNTNDDGAWYDVYVEPQNPLDKHSVNTVVEPSRNVSEQQRSVTQEHAASLERVPSYYTPKEIVEPEVPKAKTSVSFFVSLDSDDGKPTYKIPKRFQDQSKKATSKNTKTEAKDINKVEEPEATDSEEDIEVIEVSEGDPEYQQMNTKLQTILELNENEHPSDVNDPETGEMSPLKSKTNKGEPQEPEEFDNISEKPSTKLAKTDFDYENEPCIKKSASLVSLSQDADAEPPVLGQALESSLSETTSLDTLSADTIDNATVKLAKPEEVIEKMSQMRDSMSQSQSQSQERIHSNDPSFEEPVVRPMSALQEQSSLDIEDGDIIVYNRLQRDETRESSAQSDSVVFGDTDEDKAPELPKEEDSGRVHLMRHYTIAGDDPRGLFRSVTIDDAMEDPEPGRGINSTASFYLDDETSENIRKKMMAYSLSETDSDYFDPRKLSQEDFDIDTAMADAMGTSTETESTIVSAATKIQAGARGFLTRRRLRRASAGTKSSTLDTKASFGNDAISESLERFIEEEAAKKIQAAYRTHTRKRKGHTRKMEGISLESNLAARRQKLQRGDALRNDSTPDDEHSDAKSRAAMELKWLKMRQNSMPVQIDCEVFRVIPKHMRKRIKSADADKRK